jgi:glycosyltransferase involved in cell wall biosynthesis
MRIGILGTRGIPNNYGGYEQITERLSVGLVEKGHEVTVYNSHNHPNQNKNWKGVHIAHCYDPEYLLNTAGQFIYDLNCIRHAKKCKYDVILFMGYTSSSVWYKFFPKSSTVISNMDGLEWKRTKYSALTRKFLKYAEKLAVKYSDFHIADSSAIKKYLDNFYQLNCRFIPYGVENNQIQRSALKNKEDYFMLMARMEPENNIEMILEGFTVSNTHKNMIVVGKTESGFGKFIINKYKGDERIKFLGGIFDQAVVRSYRQNASLYFHGHSVGGTNPSLLEAMADRVVIAAHDNVFNKAVLGSDAFYFSDSAEIKRLIDNEAYSETNSFIENNYKKITDQYNWEAVIDSYDELISKSCSK